MRLDTIISDISSYLHANPIGAAAAGIILIYLLIKKPKLLLTLVIIALLGAGLMMLINTISNTGVTGKDFRALGQLKK